MAQGSRRRTKIMSATPKPRPQTHEKASKKAAARAISRLIEEHMEEMGFSEAEKNARTDAFVESVKKLKAARAGTPAK